MPVYTWVQTAATNALIDPTIDWHEGQAPSTVNDSARAMMAALAQWRDDITGWFLFTSGTSTAYAVSTFSVFTSLTAANGMMIAFRVHVTNGASPTLNVDGLGAKPIVLAPAGAALGAGVWTIGTIHSVVYDTADGQWIVRF